MTVPFQHVNNSRWIDKPLHPYHLINDLIVAILLQFLQLCDLVPEWHLFLCLKDAGDRSIDIDHVRLSTFLLSFEIISELLVRMLADLPVSVTLGKETLDGTRSIFGKLVIDSLLLVGV